jgi:hypothetical protein
MKVSLTCWVRISFLGSLYILDILLENYFEMSHVDANEALVIYRRFCKQTDLVVEYLGVARKLQNLLNVPVPHLKHVGVLALSFTIYVYFFSRPQFHWLAHFRNT